MELKRLTAAFGALDNRTIVFDKGFNLIPAPNESGKSTWCAFLRTMLYGLPTRDRGPDADKNRYAPWSGIPMEGSMDLIRDGQKLTISRRTRPGGAPMGTFSAVYTGTADPVPDLDSASCGQLLTGVPREVYERSAFIAQSSMAVGQTAELERRITALITSGQEDTSYTETAEQLKRYLSRRRYNKTGLLPAAEEEIAALERQLRQSEALQQQITQAQAAIPALEQQERSLTEELMRRQRYVNAEYRQHLDAAKKDLDAAVLRTALLRQETATLPPRSELAALKSSAGNVQVNRLTMDSLRRRLDLREQETAAAQAEADTFPLFAGLTAEEARQKAQADQDTCRLCRRRRKWAKVPLLLSLILLLATALPALFRRPLPLPLTLAGSALFLLTLAIGVYLDVRSTRTLRSLITAYGAENFTRQSEAYAAAYELLTDCRQREQEVRARLESLSQAMEQTEAEVMEAACRLTPQVSTLAEAARAIDQAIARWSRLSEAQQQQALLTARCEALSSAAEEPDDAEIQAQAALRAQLEAVRQDLDSQRRTLSAAQGQLQLTGAAEPLRSALEEKHRQRRALQQEYDAAALALEALTEANATLQNRFAPALGKKSAKYFAKLTDGKYNTVLLNRSLEAEAQEAGTSTPRPFRQLSRGAIDQLYLAVRLAICDLVLPEEQAAPLVLDDALAAFDEARMAAALDVLMETARHRQVLLFTCHQREGEYLKKAHPGQFHIVTIS